MAKNKHRKLVKRFEIRKKNREKEDKENNWLDYNNDSRTYICNCIENNVVKSETKKWNNPRRCYDCRSKQKGKGKIGPSLVRLTNPSSICLLGQGHKKGHYNTTRRAWQTRPASRNKGLFFS